MNKPTVKSRIQARQEPQNKIVVMHQDWRDLLFLHWEYDPIQIQKTLPPGLMVDTFDEKAYLGITPFSLQNLRFSLLPPVPGISNFNEINVRTYVYDDKGTPGVWFYSLDADKFLAVEGAKLINLPYRHAQIKNEKDAGSGIINFSISRLEENNISSFFSYRGDDVEWFAESNTLDFFLIERYYLFTFFKEKDKLYNIQVHHKPYPLSNAQVFKNDANLLQPVGFEVMGKEPDHIIMSPGVDVKIYRMEEVFF